MNNKSDGQDVFVMYILVNTGLKMGIGKKCAQVGHVVEGVIEKLLAVKNKKSYYNYLKWKHAGRRKIVIKASEEQLNYSIDHYEFKRVIKDDAEFWCEYVEDAGYTQIESGSLTAVAFCPIEKSKVPLWIKQLKLL